jgi:hypothetical protein
LSPTPLKNMSSPVGIMTFPIWWESHEIPWFQSPPTRKKNMYIYIIPLWISAGTQCVPFYRGNWVPPYGCIQIFTIKSGKNKNARNTSL